MISPPRAGRTAVLPPPPPVYYDLDEPIHRRPVWPWLAALFFVVVAVIGGWLLYAQISDKLASNAPVAVGNYVPLTEQLARQKIKDDGFAPVVNHHASRTAPAGQVYRQEPTFGHRIPKGSAIRIWVSTGLPRVTVPSFVDGNVTDAVAQLTRLGLKVKQRPVPSAKEAGTITAQDPPEGTKLPVGSTVTLNVAKGPQPVSVPPVVGLPLEQATSQLQALQFKVQPTFVESNEPANTVVQQTPEAGQSAGKGSTITLTVSKGPTTATVPDVTSLDVDTATATIASAGFRVKTVDEAVSDPSLDGTVLSQTPDANTEAKPGSLVTLTVGRAAGDTTTTDTTTTP
jgi:serine/threonine-protein kinase